MMTNYITPQSPSLLGANPSVCSPSQGRVNLIGEHIDYEGYSVLPIAIRQETIIAIKKRSKSDTLRTGNVNNKYSMCTYPADPSQEIDLKNHKWGRYFICGSMVGMGLAMEQGSKKKSFELLQQFVTLMITQMTQTMQIPLTYAENIIGVGGTNIAHIRRTIGAVLTVQENGTSRDEITVEIKCTSSQVQIAQNLIQNT